MNVASIALSISLCLPPYFQTGFRVLLFLGDEVI